MRPRSISSVPMFGDIIQPTHLLFILVVALLVLGPKRLPEVGRSLGRGLRDFRQGMQGVQDEARGVFGAALDEPEATESTVPVAAESVDAPAAAPVAVAVPGSEPTAVHATAEPDPADYAD
jgi:sec-independent protein translocase protein TatA